MKGSDQVVRQVEPDLQVLQFSRLPRIDYADAFAVRQPGLDGSPLRWARDMLEHASPTVRKSLLAGWTLLGLDVTHHEHPGRVLGWRIDDADDDHLRLSACSRTHLLDAHLIVVRQPDGFVFSTLVHLRNIAARAIWTPIVGPHQRVVLRLLRSSAGRWQPGSAARG